MYFSHSFILALLPLFAAAIPVARTPTPRGIAIPINKRSNATVNNPTWYANAVQNSIG